MMDWYDELRQYFPAEEFRVRAHFEWLITHRPDIYRVKAAADHLLLLVEYDEFFFIDYFYVYPQFRGQGAGSRVLAELQGRGRPILLETEPPVDAETVRRSRFYDRAGFRTVDAIDFRLPSLLTDTVTALDVLCWAPAPVSDATVYGWMERYYHDLYASLDTSVYGRPYPPVTHCLRWR